MRHHPPTNPRSDPAFRRGFQIVDVRPARRVVALKASAELAQDLRDLEAEQEADRWERPRRFDDRQPEAPERPGPDDHLTTQFPVGEPWELTAQHAARWVLHSFDHRRGDTSYFRLQGDLAEGEFSQFLNDLACWQGMMWRWALRIREAWDRDGRPCHPRDPRARQFDLRPCGPPPPPLEEFLRPGRENWGYLGAWVRKWRELTQGGPEVSGGPA